MSNTRLTVSTPDGDFAAHVAVPEGEGPFPAVLVIQEIFGLNGFVRAVADRLAAQGYLAVAPDLFWRIEPGIDLDPAEPAEREKAFELFAAFDVPTGVQDIAASLAAVRADPRCNGKVGAVGYCLGGLLAFLTALRTDADASVSYYGVGMDNFLAEAEGLRRPLLAHIAGEDGFVPKDAQARIVTALSGRPDVEVHAYPGRDHAFARIGGEHYHPADATAADARTEAFLKRYLG